MNSSSDHPNSPFISVCIPTYNRPDLFCRLMDSLQAQKGVEFEVVISDDSTDNRIQKCVELRNKDFSSKRLRYWKNPTSLGPSQNWNKSISLAKGRYIKIMHHDDWFPQDNCLLRFEQLAQHYPEASLIFSDSLIHDPKGEFVRRHVPEKKYLEAFMGDPGWIFPRNFIGPPSSVLFKNNKNI